MKCLQCGTELDRIAKWRGVSEYCSEDCRKKNQEELNELVMNRLMIPKPSRPAAVRTVDRGASGLTVVVHPVGASAPVLTEPPEARFIMEDSAKASALKRQDQNPLLPDSLLPMMPGAELRTVDALVTLAAAVSSRLPSPRQARELPRLGHGVIAIPAGLGPDNPAPFMDPVWPESLGLYLGVVGIESFIHRPEETVVTPAPRLSCPLAEAQPPAEPAPLRVAHLSIPARRPVRPLRAGFPFELGPGRLLPAPAPPPPRLRIHLPKPAFHALCPRFTFAPRPRPEPDAAGVAHAAGTAPVREAAPFELDIVLGGQDASRAPRPLASPVKIIPAEPADVEPASAPAVDFLPVPTFGFEEGKPGLWDRIRQWKKAGSAVIVLGIVLGASGHSGTPSCGDGPSPKVNSLRGSHE